MAARTKFQIIATCLQIPEAKAKEMTMHQVKTILKTLQNTGKIPKLNSRHIKKMAF